MVDALVFVRNNGTEQFPTLLFQACIAPYEKHNLPLFKLMPVDQALIYFYNGLVIYCNAQLYFYLRTQTETNVALKEADRKRDRKRNFVSARFSIIHTFFLGEATLFTTTNQYKS